MELKRGTIGGGDMTDMVTFTGVDSATSIDGLAELSRRYPRVEFGVLVGSQLGGIFPPPGRRREPQGPRWR